jgi:hypothetical protein
MCCLRGKRLAMLKSGVKDNLPSSYQQMCYKKSKNGKAGERIPSWVTEP